ncbi:MAG: hypothetical protein ACE5SW_11700 [Nitrososphaeraceae archaeon]
MNHKNTNNKSKIGSIFLLAAVLVAGTTISMGIPPSFAQSYYHQQEYEDPYAKEDRKKSADVNIQKIRCINENTNVNGVDVNQIPDPNGPGAVEAQGLENGPTDPNGNGLLSGEGINFDKNLVNVCVNVNVNEQIGEEQEPTTGSLTVKKEIFGCDNIVDQPEEIRMDCQGLGPDSTDWLSCDDATISNTIFCQALQENFFDIEVLDELNNQIQEFQGSQQGTTVDNLEPGTYTVNEIKHPPGSGFDQLIESASVQDACNFFGFPEGGRLGTSNSEVIYRTLCFEYEDEQGNDCTTNTIAAGEDKTCIVKNYISFAIKETEID